MFNDEIFKDRYQRGGESPEGMLDRVAADIASIEVNKAQWTKNFRWLMDDWKFVPAGRILAAAGSDGTLTYYNCNVLSSPKDSRKDIIVNTLYRAGDLMARGGGIGFNASSLRPKGAIVRGVAGTSSGSVSWADLFSRLTGLIIQGGSRRGALMIVLNDWHPDLIEFIHCKLDPTYMTNANITVALSDKFMDAVASGDEWRFYFPDTDDPDYDELWDGDIEKWQSLGKRVYEYTDGNTYTAKQIWDMIVSCAHQSAEPGIWFIDRANQRSNSYYYNKIVSLNPCAEQGLPPDAVCNLGSFNLPKFFDPVSKTMDWDKLDRAIQYAVRFLDNVIDVSPNIFKELSDNQANERRVGVSTMGLAELLILAEIEYGSDLSLLFVDELYRFITESAYRASTELARERGAFPAFDADKYIRSGFVSRLPEYLIRRIRKYGIRNVTLTTCAPTGTISRLVDTSSGIEPYFAWEYTATTRLGTHEIVVPAVQTWRKNRPNAPLPNYFVTAMEIAPEKHIKVQATIQRWIDSAVSKTVNCANDTPPERVSELYMLAWKLGSNSVTVYVDGSRAGQPFVVKDEKAKVCALGGGRCKNCG